LKHKDGRRPYTLSKNLKYKPTKQYIGVDTGFIQAATLLDMAAVNAVESKDFAAVAQIARQWVELSLAMKAALTPEPGGEDDDEEDHGSSHEHGPVGFGVTVKDIKEHNDRINRAARED